MKKTLLSVLSFIVCALSVQADEGMWFMKLMEQQHLADSLRKAGLQLPAEALYSETSPSLRECVGIFGGGCTGEIVSSNGLIFTNHHCGFSYVHEMSSMDHDYMKDGYFAHSRKEELPAPESLTFTFVERVVNVTQLVNDSADARGVSEYMRQSQAFLEKFSEEVLAASDMATVKGVSVRIVPFFQANEFYAFFERTYTDIRLVASPPNNVGQFGGNSDNWMWPRQNADFSVFRIYADKNGDPAPYSEKNVPLKTKKYLPISLKGLEKGDYTMIMGFPGSTSRFLTAAEVKLRTQSQNAPIVAAGNPLLAFYKNLMDSSDSLRLLLEDEYFSWGNVVKNYGGMNEAVEKTRLVDEKRAEEERFAAFAKQSGKEEYLTVVEKIDSLCSANADLVYDMRLARIALRDNQFEAPVRSIQKYVKAVREGNADDQKTAGQTLLLATKGMLAATHLDIDQAKTKLLTPYFLKLHKTANVPAYLADGTSWEAFVDSAYTKSVFTDTLRLASVIARGDTATLLSDPLYRQSEQLSDYMRSFGRAYGKYTKDRQHLDRIYVRGLCEMYAWTKAPDANFTLRMTYGHVNDLQPRDAVQYDWRTTLDGMFEKESTTESDYFTNQRLRELWEAGDFGRYAREDGKLPTCFLSDNDITGGNSGSPVMNSRGELIGLAFDGNIESLSSDLKFNARLQRCINVDIRYVLFILDKFGGSTYLLKELDLR
jgi:hypothetical protein